MTITLTHSELITKAKVILQAENPFFSYILFYCKFKPIEIDEDNKKGKHQLPIETMGIDKQLNVYYNPKFIEDNSKYIKGILMHEIMHAVLKHHARFDDFIDLDKDPKNRMIANIAMDAVINLSLLKIGISLMDGTILPENGFLKKIGDTSLQKPILIEGKSWEEIYNELKQQTQQQQKDDISYSMQDIISSDKNNNQGQGQPQPDGLLTPEQVDDIIQDATNYAKLQGKLPGEMERILDEVYNTKTPWQKILIQNFQSFIPFDYNYKKPNRRGYSLNTFIPHSNKKPSVKVYVAIDTSGSVSNDELHYFLSEVYSICKQFSLSEIIVMFCDAQIHQTQTIKTISDISKLKPSGYGGTDFRPIFDEMNNKYKASQRDMLIYFTDGFGDFPNKKPNFQTIWMTTSKKPEHYPFGKVIECSIPKNK